jgi:hypothetical protein
VAVVGVVGSGAGGVERLAEALVEPLLARGHTVPVTLTPTAHTWLGSNGRVARLEELTGLPVRAQPRLPDETSPHPPPDVLVAAPATSNTVAKLALGIADNQALTLLCENVGVTPMVVFPRVNAAHARQPAWESHLAGLRACGVRLVYGEDVWPLYEPRAAPPGRSLPWDAILTEIDTIVDA